MHHFRNLSKRWSLKKEFRAECIKTHNVSLSNELYCSHGSHGRIGGGGRGRGVGQWKARGKGSEAWQVSGLFLKEMALAVFKKGIFD